MKKNDRLKGMTGAVTIELNGKVVREIKNIVVTAGKEWIASMMDGTGTVMNHIGVGTGTTGEVVGDTDLETPVLRNPTTAGAAVGAVVTYVTTLDTTEANAALTEAGIFDALSGGNMLARTTFAVINKTSSDVMTITWAITVS